MKPCSLLPVTALLLAVFCWLGLPAGAVAALPDGEATLTLKDAIQHAHRSGQVVKSNLVVKLARQGGAWQADAYATAETYNHGLHLVTAAIGGSDDALKLELEVTFARAGGSGWGQATGPEGRAHYQVELAASGVQWAGRHGGHFRTTQRGAPAPEGPAYEVAGEARMTMEPPWPPVVAGHKPIEPGEHPRLFFRASDLEDLRKKAQTPVGQKLLARARELLDRNVRGFYWNHEGVAGQPYTEGAHAAGHAFIYALTGDRAAAERARWIAFRAMASNGGEWGSWGNSLRIPGVAVAYDLCYQAWKQSDPRFLQEAGSWLEATATGRGSNPDMHFDGTFHAAGGLAALSILGDPCPPPAAPTDPGEAPLLAAPRDFTPGRGAPVFTFTDGQIAKQWLLAGGFSPGHGGEPLAALGGPGRARPSRGDKFMQGDAEFEWKERTTDGPRIGLYKFEVSPRPKGSPVPACSADGGLPTLAYFYAVLDNDKARAVKAMPQAFGAWHGPETPIYGIRLWIAGKELSQGEVVRLDPGKYPVMMELAFAGQMFVLPRLLEYTVQRHQQDKAEHQRQLAAWESAGKAYPQAAARCRQMARFIDLYVKYCYGDQGLLSEDSTQADAIYNLLPYLVAYRNVAGRDMIAANPHVRQIMPNIILTQRRFLRHDWGIDHFRVMGFPELCDEPYRALLRHELEQNLAATTGPGAEGGYLSLPWDAMFALRNFAFGVEPRQRKDIGLPRLVEDVRFGGLVLTRDPGSTPEYQAILLAQQNAPRSCITAGDFSILVNGRLWTGYGNAGGGFFRPACLTSVEVPNVVRIQGAIPTRGAKVRSVRKLGDDGSGVITMVQDCWVDGSANDAHSSPKINDSTNLGVTAIRSIAVDYTGQCGAPMLVVVADHITAPADRVAWVQMNLPNTRGHNNQGRLEIRDNTFIVREPKSRSGGPASDRRVEPGSVTMAGAFHGPASVLIEYRNDWAEIADAERLPPHFKAAIEKAQPKPLEDARENTNAPKPRKADSMEDVLAQVEAHEQASKVGKTKPTQSAVETFFLTVITLRERDAPAVHTEGQGSETKFTIGKRTVRFDGSTLVLE